jgi:hypothetical protein
MRVLVCGGRDYQNKERVFQVLDLIHKKLKEKMIIIHGGARGADTLAGEYARERQLEELVFPADWKTHGKSAGAIRNTQMLKEGTPKLVVAFPGGNGTKHMIDISKKHGILVIVVSDGDKDGRQR